MMDRSLRLILRLLPVTTVALVLAWAVPAAAAPQPASRGKRFRLHADTEFFGVTHFDDRSTPRVGRVDSTLVGFGIGRPSLTDSGACAGGVLGICALGVRPLWGLGFGFAFAEQQGVVGARFAFTADGIFTDEDHRMTLVGGQFIPYFRWIFLPGRTVRPYVEGRFGLGGGAFTARNDDGDELFSSSVIYPTLGAGGGVHIFIIDAFSVDLGLNFDYLAPHVRRRGRLVANADRELASHVVNFAALAGFSVWF